MRKCLRACLLASTGTVLTATAASTVLAPRVFAAAEVIDRVLAIASGDVITLSDVRAAQALGRVDVEDAADPVRVILAQLIDRALVLAEVNRFAPPEPAAAAIDDALEFVAARFATPEAFESTLSRVGVDRGFVRELLREDLRIRAYVNQRFVADTPEEQRAMMDAWIAGLRRRSDVIDLYESPVSAESPGTVRPGGG
jgi:hypothetical protein